jgi:hypothetical protein
MKIDPDRAIYDPLEGDASVMGNGVIASRDGETPPERFLRFHSPLEIAEYRESPGHCLIGEYHLQLGAFAILAGAPGVGKSLALLWLAILGALGKGSWFGLKVHRQFRTLMLQAENGLVRLHNDFKQLDVSTAVDSWLRISEPPARGVQMNNPLFRAELRAVINDFAPDLLIVDPWISFVCEGTEREHHQGFANLRDVMRDRSAEMACFIAHHLRKPKPDDSAFGRGVINLMAGHYSIFSVPRSAMALQPASSDLLDRRVVFSTLKNNDGTMGLRSAWELRDGLFHRVEDKDFDWSRFEPGKREPAVTKEHLYQLFDGGTRSLPLKNAMKELMEIADVEKSAAYAALKRVGGRFSKILCERDKEIGLVDDALTGDLPLT